MACTAQAGSKRGDDASTAALWHSFCSSVGGWGDVPVARGNAAQSLAAAGPAGANA